jgi:hypothetical protein
MNPAKMRDTYGKMLYMLQDVACTSVQEGINMTLSADVQTVYGLLEERDCLEMLKDRDLLVALQVIDPNMDKKLKDSITGQGEESNAGTGAGSSSCGSSGIAAALRTKKDAMERLVARYSGSDSSKGPGSKFL